MDNLSQRWKNVDWNNLKKHALKVRGEAASKLKDFCMTEVENKVRAATSNKSWGASTSELFEIAQSTFNNEEYPLIMAIVWQRLNDHGRNWRHVYKALELLRYLLMHGSSRVMDEVQDALYHIRSLQDFRYIDPVTHKDEGANVRIKAKQVIDLVSDERLLQEERQKSKELYLKVANSGGASRFGGMSSSDLYEGYNRDYIAGSDVAVGGRYSNIYEYSETASEPVSTQKDYNGAFQVSEEEKELRDERLTGYHNVSSTEHVQTRSSTLPGAMRLGSNSSKSTALQGQPANFISSPTKAKESPSDVSDLISWDDSESALEASKENPSVSNEMINWDSDFNPRHQEETHFSSVTDKKKSPMDLLLETASDSSTSGMPNTSSNVERTTNMSAKYHEPKVRGGFIGFETSSTLQSENTQVDRNQRPEFSETRKQSSSTRRPSPGNSNLSSNRTDNLLSDSKSTSSAVHSSVDPFGSLVDDLMKTKLVQTKHEKDSSKSSNQTKDE